MTKKIIDVDTWKYGHLILIVKINLKTNIQENVLLISNNKFLIKYALNSKEYVTSKI